MRLRASHEAALAELAQRALEGMELGELLEAAVAAVARELGADATIEDNPAEAELLAEVCESWLLDRPYNRASPVMRARRVSSWDDAVGRLCQLRLFA